jgi:hypothetical protein
MAMRFSIKKGDVKKAGVSGQPRRANGSSPRANSQLTEKTKNRSGQNQLQSQVRKTAPNRKKILEWEAKQAEKRRRQGNSMDMHKRP